MVRELQPRTVQYSCFHDIYDSHEAHMSHDSSQMNQKNRAASKPCYALCIALVSPAS